MEKEIEGVENPETNEELEINNQEKTSDDLDNDEEIAQLASQVKKKLEEKKSEQQVYTQEQVDALFNKMSKKFEQKQSMDDDDYIDILDPDANKRKFVRIARLLAEDGNYKFVVGLKNINTDPYIDEEITVQNLENPNKKGELIPWSEFIFEDGTTRLYPYLAFIKNANGVWAEVLETKEEDISETFGTVEMKSVSEENEWDMKPTGKRVLAKAVKVKTTFVCKEIKTGKVLEVSSAVVNQVDASYADLKKFLSANK